MLDPYKEYVQRRYEECELSAVRLHEEIVPMGYQGGVDTIRRFVRTIRRERQGRQKMTVRFETPPGKQAQVDWASCGRIPNASGQLVPVYAYVLVLAFSRMLFVRFTTSMKLPELIRCHLEAFRYLGGWPAELLFDNMAQVRQRSGDLHPLFADFAAHYGIAATHGSSQALSHCGRPLPKWYVK